MDTAISFEFFPPKSDKGRENLAKVRHELSKLKPEYMSVTFGAGGSTQAGTLETVLDIQKNGIDAAPHLSCISTDKDSIRKMLATYKQHGIRRIVALRGDMPSGNMDVGDFAYANELIEFIRSETGDFFHLEVAAYPEKHPQAKDFYTDFNNFKRKVDAGANSAITQYFYNPDAYYHFVNECDKQGINIPVIPGIMPISNYVQLSRFSNACGAEIPRWISTRLESYGDDLVAIQEFGFEVLSRLCEDLLTIGAPGLHFYTMNKVEPALKIIKTI